MPRYLVSVPVWGERYVDVFCATALPAMRRAVEVLRAEGVPADDICIVAHTDQPVRIKDAAGVRVETRALPAGLGKFECMAQAHREVFAMALRGDVVFPLNADNLISEEALVTCARVLSGQKVVVACSAFRANQSGQVASTKSRDLHRWAWENRHAITRECTWPAGKLRDLSRICFERGGNVSARLSMPHPVAVRIDGRPLSFTPTVDANLLRNFDISEIHLVRSPDELALVELSPADKADTLVERSMEERLARGELVLPNAQHRQLIAHRVTLVGDADADCGDEEVVNRILEGK